MEAKGILAVPQVWYERPISYHPNRLNVIGNDDDVHWPRYSNLMDFELEFGAYIGKPGKDIPKERGREHIFGYTIFNDFSARDEQTLEMPGQLIRFQPLQDSVKHRSRGLRHRGADPHNVSRHADVIRAVVLFGHLGVQRLQFAGHPHLKIPIPLQQPVTNIIRRRDPANSARSIAGEPSGMAAIEQDDEARLIWQLAVKFK
jgi:hypothetical protein